jgi:hypothetical protein
MISKEPMKTGRYNATLALMSERLIFTIGGLIAKDKACDLVEAYDPKINQWF